jgi:hypothetical protein
MALYPGFLFGKQETKLNQKQPVISAKAGITG